MGVIRPHAKDHICVDADVDCEAESDGEVAAAEPRIAQCRFCHLLDEFETNQGACLVALEQVPFVFEGAAHEVEDLDRVVRGTGVFFEQNAKVHNVTAEPSERLQPWQYSPCPSTQCCS